MCRDQTKVYNSAQVFHVRGTNMLFGQVNDKSLKPSDNDNLLGKRLIVMRRQSITTTRCCCNYIDEQLEGSFGSRGVVLVVRGVVRGVVFVVRGVVRGVVYT